MITRRMATQAGRITYSIVHNKAAQRFETEWEGHTAVLEYNMGEKTIVFTHTGVPPVMEGKGVGSSLCAAGIEYAKENKLDIQPQCWFVDRYMQKKNISRSPSSL